MLQMAMREREEEEIRRREVSAEHDEEPRTLSPVQPRSDIGHIRRREEEQSSEASPGFIAPAAGMSMYDTRELLDEQEALEIGEFRVATFTLYPDSGIGQRLQISVDGAPLTLANTYTGDLINLGGSETFRSMACNSESKFTNGTDFTGNGIPDVYVEFQYAGSAGGGETVVLELSSGPPLTAGKRVTGAADPDVRELYSVSQEDCLIDIDGDGIFEIAHSDDNYQEWGGFLHSPAPSQLLRWTGEAYVVDFSLMQQWSVRGKSTSELADLARTVKAAIIDPNTQEWSVGRYANGFENVELASLSRWALNLLYAGNWEETWTFIDNAWPEARPGKDAYLEKFLETVTTSTFGPFILARRGYSKAQDVVGHKYWLGNAGYGSRGDIAGEEVYPVVKRDLVLAHFWLSQAASGGTVEFSTERTQGQNSSALDWPPAQFDASDKLTADRDYYDVLIETSGARHVAAVSDELSVLETEMTADQIDLAKRLRDGCRRPNTLSSIEKTYVNLNLEGVTCD
jgi:hypothetical protein